MAVSASRLGSSAPLLADLDQARKAAEEAAAALDSYRAMAGPDAQPHLTLAVALFALVVWHVVAYRWILTVRRARDRRAFLSVSALAGGGLASGPVSFMKGYDAFAGVIKSGGKTRSLGMGRVRSLKTTATVSSGRTTSLSTASRRDAGPARSKK